MPRDRRIDLHRTAPLYVCCFLAAPRHAHSLRLKDRKINQRKVLAPPRASLFGRRLARLPMIGLKGGRSASAGESRRPTEAARRSARRDPVREPISGARAAAAVLAEKTGLRASRIARYSTVSVCGS